jgi:hypothetical protein
MDGIFLGHNLLLSRAFRWESLDGWDFSWPQLVVVSGLSVGIPRWMGFFLATTCCCLRPGYRKAFLTNIFFFDDGISAITEPFYFFSFFTMEFRLSCSLSHEFFIFSRWNFGYHGAFFTNSFFSRWNFGYHVAFLTNSLFFHDGTWRHNIRNM